MLRPAANEQPAGPRGLRGVLSTLASLREPLGGMLSLRRRYGRFIRVPLPGAPMFLIHDPELVEHVLVTDSASYMKDAFLRSMGPGVLGQGLLTSEGELWRRQRRLVQPAFHRARIDQYASVMGACAENYIDSIRPGQQRDLQRDMMLLTLRVVLRTLLSVDSGPTTEALSDEFSVLMSHFDMSMRAILGTLLGLRLPRTRRVDRAIARVDRIVLDVIRERRAEPPGSERTDVLQMLLAARDEDGLGVTDELLRDEVVTMFSAGHETTALALAYAFLFLSQNPAAEAALLAEVRAALGGRAPTHADLPSLPYTEAVLLETMRLHPPAWSIGREACRDTELGGCPIPRGTQLIMSPWVLHRDPEHFPDPEAFRPERWLDGLQKRLPRLAYMPFGGGPRKCMGHAFAMVEAPLLLAAISRRYRLRVRLDRPLRFVLSVTARPRGGLQATVEAV